MCQTAAQVVLICSNSSQVIPCIMGARNMLAAAAPWSLQITTMHRHQTTAARSTDAPQRAGESSSITWQ